jgi:DinB superfamily
MWNRTMTKRPFAPGRTLMAALAVLALTQAAPRAAGETSDADRKTLLAHLDQTQKAFLASIQGLSEAQWKWKPAPDRWSVAEVAEHITLSESMLRGMVTDQAMKAPATPEVLAKTKGKEAAILKMIPDRTNKAQAPEMLVPKGTYPTEAATVAAFKDARAQTIALAKDTSKDLRAYAMANPAVQELDAYQWLLFLSAHTERHTKQIEEVKATTGFPAK